MITHFVDWVILVFNQWKIHGVQDTFSIQSENNVIEKKKSEILVAKIKIFCHGKPKSSVYKRGCCFISLANLIFLEELNLLIGKLYDFTLCKCILEVDLSIIFHKYFSMYCIESSWFPWFSSSNFWQSLMWISVISFLLEWMTYWYL